jgi:two-component system, LytTR family, response regulator
MLTAILIDDMPQALQVLRNDLSEHCPEISILAEANSVVSAAKLLRTMTPDVLFLDIMLGDGTGFDLLEIFPDLSSKVIFVTASEEFAIKAFRLAAIDYLLKPIAPKELKEAVQRAENQYFKPEKSLEVLKETLHSPERMAKRIALHSLDKISIVDIADIVRCEADVNNTKFFLNNGESIYVTKTLKYYEDLLSENTFLRVHQSHLVNHRFIQAFLKKDGGYLQLKNGHVIPVSVRKKVEVMELISKEIN